jgi:hypothetical protein
MSYYRIGEVVGVRGRGDFAVAEATTTRRGRRLGWQNLLLAPLAANMRGSAFAMRACVNPREEASRLFTAPAGRYSPEQIKSAVDGVHATVEKIAERKFERAEAGRAALGFTGDRATLAAYPGDIVTIRYTDATRDETVADVNIATGKIAIVARHNQSGKRWLPATMIKAVKQPVSPLPVTLSDSERAKLDEAGWVQVRRGTEFIERSYVVARTPIDARKRGTDYECASTAVYHDVERGLYHRSTGSFD